MSATGKEVEAVVDELKVSKDDKRIPVQVFLDMVYLTQMYMSEFELHMALKAADKEG